MSDRPAVAPWLQGGGQQPGMNMLGMMGDIMKLRQQQQEWGARQRFGDIMAGSGGDLEKALQAAQQDPTVGAWAPQLMTELRNQQLLQYQVGGQQLTQANTGRGMLNEALMASNTSDQLIPALQGSFSKLPPYAQSMVKPYGDAIIHSLTDGLDKIDNPDAREAEFAHRKAMLAIRTKLGSPEEAFAGTGAGVWVPPQAIDVPQPSGATRKDLIGGPQPLGGALAPGVGAEAPGRTAGGGITLGTGPTPGQVEEQKTVASKASDLQSEISDNAGHIPITAARIDLMQDALEKFQAGGGPISTFRTNLSSIMQGLRNAGVTAITQDQIDKVGNLSLTDNQVFNSQIKPFVISALKESAQGTGRVMRSEVDQFLQMADQTTDAAALMRILNMARRTLQIGYDKSMKFSDFRQALASNDPSVRGLNLMDFNSWYNRNFKEGDLVQQTPGGINLGPRPESRAKGVAPPAGVPTMRYDPTTKTLVPISP